MCSLHKNIKTHNLLSLSVFHHLNILISYVCAHIFRSVSSSEQTVQFIPLSSFLWTSKPVDWVLLFLVIIDIHIGRRYQHVLALFALLTGVILKGPTLRKFVSDVCVCMFYVCEVTGFVDWLDRGLIYICEKSLEMCICLWPEFDCPEVTLCGWQDIKIQLLLLVHNISFQYFLGFMFGEGGGDMCDCETVLNSFILKISPGCQWVRRKDTSLLTMTAGRRDWVVFML